MSDKTPTPQPAGSKKDEHQSYDLLNPTKARRVIYDGIPGSQKIITVDAGTTVRNVRLHPDVVKELNDRNKASPDSELKTRLCVGVPAEKADA